MSVLTAVQSKIAAARKALRAASGSVADVRHAIATLQSERRVIEAAPLPLAEALPVLDEAVGRVFAIHQYMQPADLLDAAAHGRPIDLRALPDQHRLALLVTAMAQVVREQFREALARHYETLQPGLPTPERQQRLREIDSQLGELEREEENMIAELADAGVSIDRRPDSDPAILLGLESTNHAAP